MKDEERLRNKQPGPQASSVLGSRARHIIWTSTLEACGPGCLFRNLSLSLNSEDSQEKEPII